MACPAPTGLINLKTGDMTQFIFQLAKHTSGFGSIGSKDADGRFFIPSRPILPGTGPVPGEPDIGIPHPGIPALPDPIDLTTYSISIDFIHPKTRVPLARVHSTLVEYFDDDDQDTNVHNFVREEDGLYIVDAANGTFRTDAGDSSKWPIGLMPVDIRYSNLGIPVHTTSFVIDVTKGHTL